MTGREDNGRKRRLSVPARVLLAAMGLRPLSHERGHAVDEYVEAESAAAGVSDLVESPETVELAETVETVGEGVVAGVETIEAESAEVGEEIAECEAVIDAEEPGESEEADSENAETIEVGETIGKGSDDEPTEPDEVPETPAGVEEAEKAETDGAIEANGGAEAEEASETAGTDEDVEKSAAGETGEEPEAEQPEADEAVEATLAIVPVNVAETEVVVAETADENASARLAWIDMAKAIGIFAVVVGHTLLLEDPLRQLLFSFHMPLFFILAGYTFKDRPIVQTVIRSAKRLLVPYVLLFAADWLIMFLKGGMILREGAVEEAFSKLFFASGTYVEMWEVPAVGLLWFLVALFFARLVFGSLTRAFERGKVREPIRAACWSAIGFGGIALGQPAKALPFPAGAFAGVEHVKLPLSLDIVMVACLFMYLGYLFKMSGGFAAMKGWLGAVVAAACVVVWIGCLQVSYLELAARTYDFWLASLAGACAATYAICWVCFWIEKICSKARVLAPLSAGFAWVGANSMAIYCIHSIDGHLVPWVDVAGGLAAATGWGLSAYALIGVLRFVLVLGLAVVYKRA